MSDVERRFAYVQAYVNRWLKFNLSLKIEKSFACIPVVLFLGVSSRILRQQTWLAELVVLMEQEEKEREDVRRVNRRQVATRSQPRLRVLGVC